MGERLIFNTIDARLVPIRDDLALALMRRTLKGLQRQNIVDENGKYVENPWVTELHLTALNNIIFAAAHDAVKQIGFVGGLPLNERINTRSLNDYCLMGVAEEPFVDVGMTQMTVDYQTALPGSVRLISMELVAHSPSSKITTQYYVWKRHYIDKRLFVLR